MHHDFPGAPLSNTWYGQALANALSSAAQGMAVDLDPATADIDATLNSQLDDPLCLGTTAWYYGVDGLPPVRTMDFVSVVLHELAHGLGFQSFVDTTTGALFLGRNDAFTNQLEQHGALPSGFAAMTDSQRLVALASDPNLHWIGPRLNAAGAARLTSGLVQGHVRMHGPNPAQRGSSLSHFSTALTPHELLEPFYTGAIHDPRLALDLLLEIGWDAAAVAVPGLGTSHMLLLVGLLLAALARFTRHVVTS